MSAHQSIFRIRRSYNQWVNNQTLEDYALRFTAVNARKWSLARVANTALGAISFLALEAIGGAITLQYGFSNAILAISVVCSLIFLAGIPICYYAAKYGVDIDLLTRGAGFGYIGSTATSLIYASFTFIFFALEAAIMAKALELLTGLPLEYGYLLSSVVIIPMVFHGITFISKFQLWTQPLWIILQVIPLIGIIIHDFSAIESWQSHVGVQQTETAGTNILLFGAAASVMFSLIAQIGEQVDFLRFLPEKTSKNSRKWWIALICAGPGWVVLGALKLSIGSFLAVVAFTHGATLEHASDPTSMYMVAYSYITNSPNFALLLSGIFVIISQLKINVTNAYAGSIAWSNFFSRLTHSHPGRVIWLIFNVVIATLLMELGVYHAFEQTLSVYAIIAVAWVAALVADLVINKPLGLSPKHIEFKRAYLYDINPVGVVSMTLASSVGIFSYLGTFGITAQALAHFIALAVGLLSAPIIAYVTRGKYYIARPHVVSFSEVTQCSICQNDYEPQDMAFCPAYDGAICSLCCSLDSRCRDSCKNSESAIQSFYSKAAGLLPNKLGVYINIRLINVIGLLGLIATITGVLLSLIYSTSLTQDTHTNQLLAETLWKVFFILLIVAGVLSWLFVLAHQSRIVAQQESTNQTKLLIEEFEAHRHTDAKLQKAKESAEAANNAKSRYLTGISHELRTPLNSILGYAQLLESNNNLPKKSLHQIEVIRRSGEHLADIIEGLLDISKIEAGRLEIQKNVIEFKPLISQIVNMFQPQAASRNLDFIYRPLNQLPNYVMGDEQRIRQILINLLSNAIKFTQKGKVEFTISYRNEVAEIKILDSGIGIAEEEKSRIFRPFERIRHPGAQPINGTGLGLTITKLLIDIMGGDITIDSNKYGGTTFTIWLMLSRAHPKVTSPKIKESLIGYHGNRKSLMIIDDDAAHRGLIHDLLSPLNFIIAEAHDGLSCLEQLASYQPDIFLIDRRMPGLDGPSLAKEIRVRGFQQPIIMISANAEEESAFEYSTPNYNAYILKPIKLNTLLEKLAEHLELNWIVDSPKKPQSLVRSDWVYPNAETVDELLGWAEVGALSKLESVLARLQEENQVSRELLEVLYQLLQNVALEDFKSTLGPHQ